MSKVSTFIKWSVLRKIRLSSKETFSIWLSQSYFASKSFLSMQVVISEVSVCIAYLSRAGRPAGKNQCCIHDSVILFHYICTQVLLVYCRQGNRQELYLNGPLTKTNRLKKVLIDKSSFLAAQAHIILSSYHQRK